MDEEAEAAEAEALKMRAAEQHVPTSALIRRIGCVFGDGVPSYCR
jgi:hypothetical protein